MIFRSLSKTFAKTTMAIALGLTAMATTAQAVPVSFMGTDYEVSTFTGSSYADNETLLESQVWFGDVSAANHFATEVNTQLGANAIGVYGPYFATSSFTGFNGPAFNQRSWDIRINATNGEAQSATNTSWVFATATAVTAIPLPAGGLLLLAGLFGLTALRLNKKHAA